MALPPRRALQEQYRAYIRNISPEGAGRLELEDADRPITERSRLKAAAKAEGLSLHIQRQGRTIVFWVTDEPPPTRKRAPAKPPGRGGRGRR
jgi:hypothetical protein